MAQTISFRYRYSYVEMDCYLTADGFDELREPLRRYLVNTGALPSEADDAVQETFLRLVRHLRGNSLANVHGWVFRVAQNYIRDERRKARRYPTVSLDDPAQSVARSLDSGGTPEQKTLTEERAKRLRDAIERLSPREREFVSLRSSGLKYREIAEIMEISLAAVSGIAMRTTTRLAEEIL